MDWDKAIEHNRKGLKDFVAAMAITLGFVLALGNSGKARHRPLLCALLRFLRPAESALRRLIVLAARTLPIPDITPGAARDFSAFNTTGSADRIPAFRLIDPAKRFLLEGDERPPGFPLPSQGRVAAKQTGGVRFPIRRRKKPPTPSLRSDPPPVWEGKASRSLPRISFFGGTPLRQSPKPKAPEINLTTLHRRFASLARALDNLPREAKRLARTMARRRAAPPGPKSTGPIRPGFPPGQVRGSGHPMHLLLRECHTLVLDHFNAPP